MTIETSATFDTSRIYRYALWRRWRPGSYVMFIGLNPSTADETTDDPTIRRCIGFAKRWGLSGLCMANLFAFRATDPDVMKRAADPVGPENDNHLVNLAVGATYVIAAWGTLGVFRGRDAEVRNLLPDLYYLRLTKHGHPAHPLYLPADLYPAHPLPHAAKGKKP